MKKKIILGLMLGTLTFGFGTGVLAATGLEPIKAYLNSKISLKMNGETLTVKDANGKTVMPITYDGTTYLPIRGLATLLGTEITYDNATSSVIIGGSSGSTPSPAIDNLSLSSLAETVLGTSGWHTKDPKDTSYNGKDYKDVYLNYDAAKQGKSFQVMTSNKYSSLHLELATLKGSQDIQIIDHNNTILKTFTIAPSDGLVPVDVDVANTDFIFVEIVNAEPESALFVPLTTSYLEK